MEALSVAYMSEERQRSCFQPMKTPRPPWEMGISVGVYATLERRCRVFESSKGEQ